MDKEELIKENKSRIEAMANKLRVDYSLSNDITMDLISDGYVSLMEQASSYDKSLGVTLLSYARNGVYETMLRSIQRMITTYDIPEHLNKQFSQIGRIKKLHPNISGSTLTDLIATELKVSKKKANELITLFSRTRSNFDEISEDQTFTEINSYDEELLLSADTQALDRIRTLLDTVIKPRHAEFIRLRYGIDREQMSCAEIAEQFCVTESDVRKTIKVAVSTLKALIKQC